MDKSVIFAVAGSGKTTLIISKLSLSEKALIITYTNNNVSALRVAVIKKFGYLPGNIKILSYFNFLYSYCYRPFLAFTLKARGINWKPNPNLYAQDRSRYIDDYRRLYSNRIAKLLEEMGAIADINERLSKYFESIFIDEVQDFAGNDFNLLKQMANAKAKMLLVGDFYQHTFDTSRDGKVNGTLHDDYNKYQKVFEKAGFIVDTASLIKSHRCSPSICEFITQNIGIKIDSHRTDRSDITVVKDARFAESLYTNNSIVKLFYQENYKYNCYSKNWGECKGEDKYEDVCVVLNKKTWDYFIKNKMHELVAQTKNKLYVACSRTKRDLYLVSEEHLKKYKKI